jgi:hypothetical protein
MPDLLASVPLIIPREVHFIKMALPHISVSLPAGTWIEKFPDRCISRGGPIVWSPRSLNLYSLDFFLRGYIIFRLRLTAKWRIRFCKANFFFHLIIGKVGHILEFMTYSGKCCQYLERPGSLSQYRRSPFSDWATLACGGRANIGNFQTIPYKPGILDRPRMVMRRGADAWFQAGDGRMKRSVSGNVECWVSRTDFKTHEIYIWYLNTDINYSYIINYMWRTHFWS